MQDRLIPNAGSLYKSRLKLGCILVYCRHLPTHLLVQLLYPLPDGSRKTVPVHLRCVPANHVRDDDYSKDTTSERLQHGRTVESNSNIVQRSDMGINIIFYEETNKCKLNNISPSLFWCTQKRFLTSKITGLLTS